MEKEKLPASRQKNTSQTQKDN